MKIIRYSNQGYKAQEQTYHIEKLNGCFNNFNIADYPEHLKEIIKEINERHFAFYNKHQADLKRGIWCFIDGYKDNLSLNHIKKRVACWEAEVPDDIECYDCNWERLTTISDSIVLCGGCFIPEREIYKIKNIRRRK